jgi:hypothetical protein
VFRAEKDAADEDGERVIPVVHLQVRHGTEGAAHARVVHDTIEPAEELEAPAHGGLHVGFARDVGAHELHDGNPDAIPLVPLRHQRLARGGVEIGHEDAPAPR